VRRTEAIGAFLFLWAAWSIAQAPPSTASRCAEVVSVETHGHSTMRYAYLPPAQPGIVLALLAGGSGYVDLDERGCARLLTGNSLVRSVPLFAAAGFGVALIDAPSDYQGEDGLGGFRTAPEHAQDLGKVIEGLRARTRGAVWLVGTSRGTISAANAAARLSGAAAPDGLVLTSALMAGERARKPWVIQTVFDVPLEAIRMPVLVVGHAADVCARSPPGRVGDIAARIRSARRQLVTVSGGPPYAGAPSIGACEGKAPHGYAGQEEEVAAGIARFVRGGSF
jgi:pimeloyl-ACP methyl ester carboxylesterase